jgi:hypothetical protein
MKNLLLSNLALCLLFCACNGNTDDEAATVDGTVSIDALMAAGLASELTSPEALSGSVSAAADDIFVRAMQLAPCGTASRDGDNVTLTISAGCVLANGQSVSGSLTVQLFAGDNGTAATFDFDELNVDGRVIDGTAAVEASASSLTIGLNLTTTRGAIEGDLTVTTDGTTLGIDGTLVLGGMTSLDFDAVTWETGACYPGGGSLSVSTGPVTQTIVFDAASADSGAVIVRQGSRTRAATLPAYGACPSAG